MVSTLVTMTITIILVLTLISTSITLESEQRQPKCFQSTRYGQHGFMKLKDTGITLHYVETGNNTNKPLILFMHGMSDFWLSWRHQLKQFNKTHWVVAIDLPGYADSDSLAKVEYYSLDVVQRVIVEFVHQLGRTDCILVGHDYGGLIAWTVAAYNPTLISKLIIFQAPHPNAFRDLMKVSVFQRIMGFIENMFSLPAPVSEIGVYLGNTAFLWRIIFLTTQLELDEMRAYKCTYRRVGAYHGTMNYFRANPYLNPFPYKPFPDKVKAPTLVIWPVLYPFWEERNAEFSRKYVEAEMKIVYVENAIAFVQSEMPATANRLIEEFIN